MSTTDGPFDKLARTRLALLAVALALTLIGILFVHSTTSEGEPFPSAGARGQMTKALVALLVFAVVTRINYRVLERFAYVIFGGLCLVLAGMFVLKVTAGGARSFIQLKVFQVQPSELMKVAMVLALARYLRFREDQRTLPGLAGPFGLMLLPMGLVLLQPDLGTSLMFPPMLVAMLYVAGSRPRHLLAAVLLCALSLPTAYFASCILGDDMPFMRGYQRARITSFFEQSDPLTRGTDGLHLLQSKIALGSGGLTGKGLGEGTQNTLRHLYEKHTDFIYGVIGEEWGFVGASAVVFLFWLLLSLGLRVALLTREPFGRLAVTGVAVGLAAQSLENIGMTMGLTPITGVPLPFVSHGGSSLVTSYLGLAVAFSVAGERVRVVAPKDLDPEETRKTLPILDDRPAGGLQGRWPVE